MDAAANETRPRFTSRRVQAMPGSVFTAMDDAKADAHARGLDVIDLSIGASDLVLPAAALAALRTAVDDPATHGYCLGMSRSVLDSALGEFRRQLEYKAVWNRTHLAVVDRWYPSTRLCRECGTLNALTLADRVWTCGCGTQHDRDLNAVLNIEAEGSRMLVAARHAETECACGRSVWPLHLGAVAVEGRIRPL